MLLLSQNKSPLGLLLAAGCPQSVKDPATGNALLPDMAGLTRIISDWHDSDADGTPYKRLMEELTKAKKNTKNLEEVLIYIRSI